MKNNRFQVLFVFITLFLFVANAYAYWVWSPTESKYLRSEDEKKSEEQVTATSVNSVPSATSPIVAPIEKLIAQKPVSKQVQSTPPIPILKQEPKQEEPKQEKKAAVRERPTSENNLSRILTATRQQLLKGRFLKPKSQEPQRVPEGQFWSPAQGKFVSPAAAVDQKTADDLFQKAQDLRKQKGKDKEVIRQLQFIVKHYNQSAYAPEAQFLIATIFEERENLLRAASEFKKVVREFPRSQRIEEAIERLFKIGNLFLTGEKQKVMGVAIIPVYSKAVDIFNFIVEQAPYGPYGDQSQLKLGITYRKMGNFTEAVNAFQALITNYPTSPLVDEAHYQLAETSYELSQNAVRDQSTTSQASLHLKDFIKQYSGSSLSERAKLLKQQLDEQDAEKNYRIGLYYEKQGAVESALIYYEDVAERYSETPFGKKAAQRLQTLREPIRAMEKGEAAIQQRIAEVTSMLEALEQQEQQPEKGKKVVSETGDLQKQLKEELASLRLGQKEFKNEAVDNFYSRKRTLRQRQKNLREKFKTFKSRKKQLVRNQSPELQEVLDRWHASLVAEQEELTQERRTLNELGKGFTKQKIVHLDQLQLPDWMPKQKMVRLDRWRIPGWMPYKKVSRKEAPAQISGFDQKKWNKFQIERIDLVKKRIANEEELHNIGIQFKEIEQQEFDVIENIPNLAQLIPAELLGEKENMIQKKSELDGSIQNLEQIRKKFQDQFGPDFIQNLGNESQISKMAAVHSLLESGKNLDELLAEQQIEFTSLSEAWLDEKDKLATMARAFNEGKPSPNADQNLAAEKDETGDQASQANQTRLLKKRMKYLEREIRSRIDQIQDWKRDNAKRMKKLDQLLKPEVESRMTKVADKVIVPAKGTYQLTKAFFFGLENKDLKLMEQADAEVKKNEAIGNIADERIVEIRELQEEIELQSILIQGRTSEINDLQSRLRELQAKAQAIPGFSYQSLLIERIPSDLAYTVDTAKKLFGLGNKEGGILKRLDAQSRQLRNLEGKIAEQTNQIEITHLATEQKKGSQSVKPAIVSSISGDAETLPEDSGTQQVDDQNKAQTQMIQMKAEINIRQAAYEQTKSSYRQSLLDWYHASGRNQLGYKVLEKVKNFSVQKSHLQQKISEIQKFQSELLKKEAAVVKAQKGFTDLKINELEHKLEKLKDPSDVSYQALMSEIKTTQGVRDSLIRDLTTLQSS